MNLLYLLFAILGLGFLIFIHELGHYWMARRVGMRVESFGIGFGRPIISFMRKGVKWNICWLPFGGYVKIAGMEKENGKDPDQIPDGFFGKSPIDRIKVAIMGPLANLILAFVLFTVIWMTGGREKNYGEITNRIGWVDSRSDLYKNGIRPGDIILKYDGESVHGAKDHFHAAMTGGKAVHVDGLHWNAKKMSYEPFSIDIQPYPHPQALEGGILTTGVLSPASFIIFPEKANGVNNFLPQASPLEESGIQYGDRIVWVNGESVNSLTQLSAVLNDGRALLTIKRGAELFLRRVPRVAVGELKLNKEVREELTDWQWESNLKATKFQELFFIPYNLTADCKVEDQVPFSSNEKNNAAFGKQFLYENEAPLLPGDKIVAVDGTPVRSSYQLLSALQTYKSLIIVERASMLKTPQTLSEVDQAFENGLHSEGLADIAATIGTKQLINQKNSFYLLKAIEPKTRSQLLQLQDKADQLAAEMEEEKRHILAIDNPEKRAAALKYLENREQQLLLGLPGVQDAPVLYNPTPVQMFSSIVDEVVHTLSSLVGGYLNPKWISGPIGIVQVIHHQWMAGVKEALFWLGAISLNLGLLNLLPLPVLDGGYICLSLFEILTGKRLKAKTIEKIVIPFAIFLISFLIFLTYHDLLRLIGGLIK